MYLKVHIAKIQLKNSTISLCTKYIKLIFYYSFFNYFFLKFPILDTSLNYMTKHKNYSAKEIEEEKTTQLE